MLQEWKLTCYFPPDLHVWKMFIKPEELKASLERHGLHNQDIKGTRLGNPVQMLRAFATIS